MTNSHGSIPESRRMQWEDVPECVDTWTEKVADLAYTVRQAAANLITNAHVGYYVHPVTFQVGLYGPLDFITHDQGDGGLCKRAAIRAGSGSCPVVLDYLDLSDPNCCWIKVAYSPALRRAGELLNFFPGQYPGGIPNAPSPLAAMLTSGLVGAGLGWGAGRMVGAVLPPGVGKKLGRTGALLGGAIGAAPGTVWGLGNKSIDKSFNDPSVLSPPANSEPQFPDPAAGETPMHPGGASSFLGNLIVPRVKHSLDLIELGSRYKEASETFANFYQAPPRSPMDVNINAIGQTLWEHEASPNLAATTMGALYAAQQLPDPDSRAGWVTSNQLGELAANTTGDYLRGLLVGATLNQVVGTPFRASTYGLGNATLGIIGAVVPKLFGR